MSPSYGATMVPYPSSAAILAPAHSVCWQESNTTLSRKCSSPRLPERWRTGSSCVQRVGGLHNPLAVETYVVFAFTDPRKTGSLPTEALSAAPVSHRAREVASAIPRSHAISVVALASRKVAQKSHVVALDAGLSDGLTRLGCHGQRIDDRARHLDASGHGRAIHADHEPGVDQNMRPAGWCSRPQSCARREARPGPRGWHAAPLQTRGPGTAGPGTAALANPHSR